MTPAQVLRRARLPHLARVGGGQRKVIIDVDMGADDAVALLALLQAKQVDILAVTSVSGNVHVDQAAYNVGVVLRNMDNCERIDSLPLALRTTPIYTPIFKGCARGIISPFKKPEWEGHGKDGLGDSKALKRDNVPQPQPEHAVTKIVELVQASPGEVELLFVGPLTNLAMAIRLEPSLPSLVKRLVIMGGCTQGKGNTSAAAEFNFLADPEAAHIVMDAFQTDAAEPSDIPEEGPKISLVGWEVCLETPLTWQFFDRLTGLLPGCSSPEGGSAAGGLDCPAAEDTLATTKAGFCLKEVSGTMESMGRKPAGGAGSAAAAVEGDVSDDGELFTPCDMYAAAILLDPTLATASQQLHVTVDTGSSLSRGATIIDWYGRQNGGRVNCNVITAMDQNRFEQLMETTFCSPDPIEHS